MKGLLVGVDRRIFDLIMRSGLSFVIPHLEMSGIDGVAAEEEFESPRLTQNG